MKTVQEILKEKVGSRHHVISMMGMDIRAPHDRGPVRKRLAEDPALKWLAQAVGSETYKAATDSIYNPASPFDAAANMELAFAEAIMLWEEANNEFNKQLIVAPQ